MVKDCSVIHVSTARKGDDFHRYTRTNRRRSSKWGKNRSVRQNKGSRFVDMSETDKEFFCKPIWFAGRWYYTDDEGDLYRAREEAYYWLNCYF